MIGGRWSVVACAILAACSSVNSSESEPTLSVERFESESGFRAVVVTDPVRRVGRVSWVLPIGLGIGDGRKGHTALWLADSLRQSFEDSFQSKVGLELSTRIEADVMTLDAVGDPDLLIASLERSRFLDVVPKLRSNRPKLVTSVVVANKSGPAFNNDQPYSLMYERNAFPKPSALELAGFLRDYFPLTDALLYIGMPVGHRSVAGALATQESKLKLSTKSKMRNIENPMLQEAEVSVFDGGESSVSFVWPVQLLDAHDAICVMRSQLLLETEAKPYFSRETGARRLSANLELGLKGSVSRITLMGPKIQGIEIMTSFLRVLRSKNFSQVPFRDPNSAHTEGPDNSLLFEYYFGNEPAMASSNSDCSAADQFFWLDPTIVIANP